MLEHTDAAGLMLARGAIADPWLFHRLRGQRPTVVGIAQRRQELSAYLLALCHRYDEQFNDETLVLFRLKDVVNHIHDEWFAEPRYALRRCKKLDVFAKLVTQLAHESSPERSDSRCGLSHQSCE